MHPPLILLFILLYFAAAAPASTTTSTHSQSHSSSSSTTSQFTVHNNKPPISQGHHTVPDPTRTPTEPSFTPHPPIIPTFTPARTHSPKPGPPLPTETPLPSHGQKPISIVFEVLGGLFASGLLLGLIRCLHNYRKTPGRDRIADIVHRHQLQRQMEELERNPDLLRRDRSVREPAPPYFPRPPSYDRPSTSNPPISVIPRQPHPQPDMSQYSAVATYSPPSTPTISERILLPAPAATPRTHPEVP